MWQGQRGTKVPRSGMYSLAKLVPHLEALHPELPLRLTVIGNSQEAFRSVLGDARFPVRYGPGAGGPSPGGSRPTTSASSPST